MSTPVGRILFWIPRLAGILFVVFISIFSLDIFDMGLGFWGTILGLFMHLLPSIILAVAVALAWRREWIGAVLFLGWSIFYMLWFRGFEWYIYAMLAGIPAVIGVLFLIGWIWRKQFRTG